ncbi:cell division protein FtsL [Enterococcus columbae]|uniref:Cell division protein FtsL n=1 Tax=Enterococcus columbae DSM 7374 = ATCC 51263 TaxID=1121865 RepID=S1MUT1_9ENTE|nr:cell division protein FtsL [Enterococcus columbae]EOT42040.1 cell division protein FtsL [Enterococcus columbae DSM 7374 = ATCC 51263]EOW80597.1 cell division protein FtsL [Enterococcus columbae DSM 7374 = ATCC 51263]OJG26326.1 cell division protein FtsL [Enterococcus columbae DSM 7374 = ATCC 51263]
MAELKFEDYSFDLDSPIEQPIEQVNYLSIDEVQRPKVAIAPQSPALKLKRISLLEKTLAFLLLVSVVLLALGMIYVRTSVNQLEHNITIVENEISTNEKDITRLQQEKNELSKAERIKQIAEKLGLSINDDNLKKVK